MFMAGMPMNVGNMGNMPGMGNIGNMGMMNMNMQGNQQQQQQQGPTKQQQPANLFNDQLTRFRSNDSDRDTKAVYPLKRSAYHVAISYKIYLDRLKKEGRTFDNLEDIDPTKSARRVKTHQGGRSGSNSLKKKK